MFGKGVNVKMKFKLQRTKNPFIKENEERERKKERKKERKSKPR